MYNGGEISIHESFGSNVERGILTDASAFESLTGGFSEKFYASTGTSCRYGKATMSIAYRQQEVVLIRSSTLTASSRVKAAQPTIAQCGEKRGPEVLPAPLTR
jgi:hypothetical protein